MRTNKRFLLAAAALAMVFAFTGCEGTESETTDKSFADTGSEQVAEMTEEEWKTAFDLGENYTLRAVISLGLAGGNSPGGGDSSVEMEIKVDGGKRYVSASEYGYYDVEENGEKYRISYDEENGKWQRLAWDERFSEESSMGETILPYLAIIYDQFSYDGQSKVYVAKNLVWKEICYDEITISFNASVLNAVTIKHSEAGFELKLYVSALGATTVALPEVSE